MVRAGLSTSTGPVRARRPVRGRRLALKNLKRPRPRARVLARARSPLRNIHARENPTHRHTLGHAGHTHGPPGSHCGVLNLNRSPLTSRQGHSRSDRQLDNWQPSATGVFNRDPSRIRSPSKSRSRLTTTARESAPTSLTIARLCRSEPWLMWGEQAQYTPLCGCGVQAGCGAKKVRAKVA
jgi:hypothetical protein